MFGELNGGDSMMETLGLQFKDKIYDFTLSLPFILLLFLQAFLMPKESRTDYSVLRYKQNS